MNSEHYKNSKYIPSINTVISIVLIIVVLIIIYMISHYYYKSVCVETDPIIIGNQGAQQIHNDTKNVELEYLNYLILLHDNQSPMDKSGQLNTPYNYHPFCSATVMHDLQRVIIDNKRDKPYNSSSTVADSNKNINILFSKVENQIDNENLTLPLVLGDVSENDIKLVKDQKIQTEIELLTITQNNNEIHNNKTKFIAGTITPEKKNHGNKTDRSTAKTSISTNPNTARSTDAEKNIKALQDIVLNLSELFKDYETRIDMTNNTDSMETNTLESTKLNVQTLYKALCDICTQDSLKTIYDRLINKLKKDPETKITKINLNDCYGRVTHMRKNIQVYMIKYQLLLPETPKKLDKSAMGMSQKQIIKYPLFTPKKPKIDELKLLIEECIEKTELLIETIATTIATQDQTTYKIVLESVKKELIAKTTLRKPLQNRTPTNNNKISQTSTKSVKVFLNKPLKTPYCKHKPLDQK